MAQRFLGIQKNNVSLISNAAAYAMTFSAHLPMNLAISGLSSAQPKRKETKQLATKKQGGISAYRKAFLIIWRWIFKEKTEEIWSSLFFTTRLSWMLNFIITFNNVFTSTDIGGIRFKSGRQSRAAKMQPFFVYLHQYSLQQ